MLEGVSTAARPPRTIFCLDLDAFFVSVERRLDPSLVGRVVVVGGEGGRGVVTAASYEARAYGVRSAMPGAMAAERLRGVKDVVWISPSRGEYGKASEEVRAVLESELPVLEQASIDEFYADVTPLLTGGRAGFYDGGVRGEEADPLLIARHTALRVDRECGLPMSVGIGASRLVAKIATDGAKPRGALHVRPGLEARYLAPLPVEIIPGIGAKTAPRLHALGVRLVGDAAAVGEENIAAAMGARFAAWLSLAAQGIDETPVGGREEARSLGQEETFDRDIADGALLEAVLAEQAERVAHSLRAEGLKARGLQVKLRYAARRGGFVPGRTTRDVYETVSRAATLDAPTADGRLLLALARALLRAHWRKGEPVRLLGIAASRLEPAGTLHERQAELFPIAPEPPGPGPVSRAGPAPEPPPPLDDDRAREVTRTLDAIRDRFGFGAISWGSAVRPPGS